MRDGLFAEQVFRVREQLPYVLLEKLILIFVILSFLVATFLISTRGFDLTDDGFYYLAASLDPSRYIHNSPFAAFSSILWRLSGADVVAFRAVGVLLLFLAALVFVASLRGSHARDGISSGFFSVALAIVVTAGYYSLGLPGLSYNWGSLVGLLLLAGPLLGDKTSLTRSGIQKLGLTLVPVGVFLVLTSKWSALVVFIAGVSIAGVLAGRGKLIARYSMVLVFSSIIVLGCIALWLPVTEFFQLLSLGYSQVLILNPEYGLLQAVERFLTTFAIHAVVGFAAYLVVYSARLVATRLVGNRELGDRERRAPIAPDSLLVLLVLAGLGMAQYSSAIYWSSTSLTAAVLASVGVQFLGSTNSFLRSRGLFRKLLETNYSDSKSVDLWPIAVSCLLCFSHAFGSANGAFNVGMSAGVIFVTVLVWVGARTAMRKLAAAVTIFACSQTFVWDAVITPYRGANLFTQTQEVEIRGSRLKVDPYVAAEMEGLRECAVENGWSPKTGLYDFTSWHPGLVFFLDASVPAAVLSHLRGYPGSKAYSLAVVQREELSDTGLKFERAWVLLPSQAEEDSVESRDVYRSVTLALQTANLGTPFHLPVCESGEWELMKPNE